MKARGYRVRIEPTFVVVEHRASFRPRTVAILVILYLGYCCLPAIRKVLSDFVRSHDPVVGIFLLFFLLIPFLSGFTWLVFQSGEVFRCDAEVLHIGQRRTLGRWHRTSFSKQGTHLSWTFVFRSKARSYEAVQVENGKSKIRVLEEISREEAHRVLSSCKNFGWEVSFPEMHQLIDDREMKADISRRGWFVNPWRPDEVEAHPKEQQ